MEAGALVVGVEVVDHGFAEEGPVRGPDDRPVRPVVVVLPCAQPLLNLGWLEPGVAGGPTDDLRFSQGAQGAQGAQLRLQHSRCQRL